MISDATSSENDDGQNQARLTAALRRNQGRLLRDRFLDDVSAATRLPPSAIVLENLDLSDSAWSAYLSALESCRKGGPQCFRQRAPAQQAAAIRDPIAMLRSGTTDTEVFLFRALSEFCGAVRVGLHTALDAAFELAQLDQDDLMLITTDMKLGLNLTYATDRGATFVEEVYELVVWGEGWVSLLGRRTETSA